MPTEVENVSDRPEPQQRIGSITLLQAGFCGNLLKNEATRDNITTVTHTAEVELALDRGHKCFYVLASKGLVNFEMPPSPHHQRGYHHVIGSRLWKRGLAQSTVIQTERKNLQH